VNNCSFTSGGTGHAIEITATGTYTLSAISFAGYAASNGSTGNEAIFVNVASGTVTINADSALSYRTAGATVVLNVGQRTLTLTGLVTGSDIVLLQAGTETEIVNVDANAATTYLYTYTYSAGVFIDVAVYKAGYVPYIVRNYQLQNGNASLPIAQVIDRNYLP
jgi:hypothetical protein